MATKRAVTRLIGIVLIMTAAILPLTLAGCGSTSNPSAASTAAAPKLSDADATARTLLTSWLDALKSGDRDQLAAFLAPNFQIQRSDGTSANRSEYLANPAKVDSYQFGARFHAEQSGATLSVTWSLRVTETINGAELNNVEAPRLTVFSWLDGEWKIVGYGNFSPIPAPTR